MLHHFFYTSYLSMMALSPTTIAATWLLPIISVRTSKTTPSGGPESDLAKTGSECTDDDVKNRINENTRCLHG